MKDFRFRGIKCFLPVAEYRQRCPKYFYESRGKFADYNLLGRRLFLNSFSENEQATY